MPEYVYECQECKAVWHEFYKIVDMDIPLNEPCQVCEKETDIKRVIFSPPIGDPVRLGIIKPPPEFRERLKQIQKNNPHHHRVRDR